MIIQDIFTMLETSQYIVDNFGDRIYHGKAIESDNYSPQVPENFINFYTEWRELNEPSFDERVQFTCFCKTLKQCRESTNALIECFVGQKVKSNDYWKIQFLNATEVPQALPSGQYSVLVDFYFRYVNMLV